MREPLFISVVGGGSRTPRELREFYGEEVRISRRGAFTLVHLDRPSRKTMSRRLAALKSGEMFSDSCAACRQIKNKGGDLIFGLEVALDGDEWIELRNFLEAFSHGHPK